jgi:hypothetical protein
MSGRLACLVSGNPEPRRRRLRRDTRCRVAIKTNGTDWAIQRDSAANAEVLAAHCWHEVCFSLAMRKPTRGRKLLIASVGVATINYVAACGGESHTSGNLVAPPEGGSAHSGQGGAAHAGIGGLTSGNLVPPPPAGAGGTFTSGNLVPPPPAGAGGRAGAGGATSGGTGGVGTAGTAGNGVSGSAGRAGAGHGGGGGLTSGNLVPPPIAGAGGKGGGGGTSGSSGKSGAGGTSGVGGSGGQTGGVAGQ